MDVEVEETPNFLEAITSRTDIPLKERINALLNELFGEIESELDSDSDSGECDEYDASEEADVCYEEEVEEKPCPCNLITCQKDCGILSCGCIDICRGRCGMRN